MSPLYRAILCRLAVVLLALLLTFPAMAAPAHRVKPIRSITVKAMSTAHFEARAKGRPYVLTAVDKDSCTVWVAAEPVRGGDPLAGDASIELAAYKACRVAMATKGGR